jgi:hypothetical protein
MSDTEYSDAEAPQSEPIPAGSGADVDRDLLIDDMAYEDARNYVMNFLVAEKKTKAALQEKEAELYKWNERLAFAEKKGMTDILEEAKRHLHFLVDEKAKLKAELEALQRKNTVLKEKLQHKAKTKGIPSSAHAEQLLSDLGQLADVGEYKLNEAMKQQEAEDELAKLKAKLGMQ